MPQRLWAAAQEHHDELRRTPFLVALTFGRLPLDAYADWLAQLYFLHEYLAQAEQAMAYDPIATAMARSAPISLPALASDLRFLHGRPWQDRIAALPVTTVYCSQLRDVAVRDINGFVAHHYARHIEDLSTAPDLAQAVRVAYRLDDAGCRFLSSDDTDLEHYRDRYHQLLDTAAGHPMDRKTLATDSAKVQRMYLDIVQELGRRWL
jgi:heme oxygenase